MDLKELVKDKRLLVPALIFVIAFMPRVYYMNDGLFHTDSVFQAIAVESVVDDFQIKYMHAPGYPGQVVLGSLTYVFFKLFG